MPGSFFPPKKLKDYLLPVSKVEERFGYEDENMAQPKGLEKSIY